MLRTNTKTSVLWLATAAFVAFALPAAAQEDGETDYSREGPYFGLSGSFVGDVSTNNLSENPGGGTSHTGGADFRIGFRMVPEMAIELAGDWAHLGGRNPWSVYVATKLYVLEMLDEENQGGRIQPYAIATAGVISGALGKDKDPSASFKFGAGLDYWLTEDLALVTQVHYNTNSGEASRYRTITGSLGVNWRY
jgi:hypothetical protein